MYPIGRFFDFLVARYYKAFSDNNSNPRRINDIINDRYRKRGYKIYWLMFSDRNDYRKPDLSQASRFIKISKKDIVIAAGISYKNLVIDKKYPEPSFILSQVKHLTKLAIGGFHQWDCVDKLARFAYYQGIPTFVDEDTTEMFFEKSTLSGEIPLYRKQKILLGTGKKKRFAKIIEKVFCVTEQEIENIIQERKERPWLRQI